MPDPNGNTLPPLPEDKFDGVKESKELIFIKCPHKDVSYQDGTLRCKCGSGWSGSNLDILYKAFKGQ